jgi:4-nitrophenyl phosphatase
MKTLDTANIQGLILDMDGVLWRSNEPIGNLPAIFEKINALGLKVILATNNATKTPAIFLKKLAGLGVNLEPWQVINSALATGAYLKNRFPHGGNIFVVGDESLVNMLSGYGFQHHHEDVIAVVAALDRGINYKKLEQATLLIRSGVPFIGTNPDKSFPIPGGEAPGAGAIIALLEAASDVTATVIGKPRPDMYLAALDRLGTSPKETLVVGDRLETDIAGAQNAGCPCAVVQSGVSTLEKISAWEPKPDIVAKDLHSVLNLFSAIRDES